jgi:hypothetical protein
MRPVITHGRATILIDYLQWIRGVKIKWLKVLKLQQVPPVPGIENM